MKLLKFAERTISVLGLFLFGILSGFSLFYTVYYTTEYEEIPYEMRDIFLLVLLVCAVFVLLMSKMAKRILINKEKQEQHIRMLLGAVLLYVFCFSIFWTLGAHCIPVGDQASVCIAAEGFQNGDYSMLTKASYEKYLYIHPHQLGLTAFIEIIFAIFGNGNILAFQLLSCVGIVFCIYSGFRIVCLLTDKREAWIYYLFLAAGCFPLFFYATFVYGEIPSLTFSFLAVWLFLEYQKAGRIWCFALSCLLVSLACLVRSNSVIVCAALLCVLVFTGIEKKSWKQIVLSAVLILSLLVSRWGLRTFYENRTGLELNKGAPMILYVAMGMQEGERGPGWSNGYILHAYWGESDFDGKTAADMAVRDIKACAKKFLENPLYAGKFYLKKFTSQWNDPSYECFVMTNINGAERNGFVNSMYDGKLHSLMIWFMNQYQSLIFIGVFFWILFDYWRKKELADQVLLIVIFGGFLFHMIWEAKGRYILPYFVMMMPMAAMGLCETAERIESWQRSRRKAEVKSREEAGK